MFQTSLTFQGYLPLKKIVNIPNLVNLLNIGKQLKHTYCFVHASAVHIQATLYMVQKITVTWHGINIAKSKWGIANPWLQTQTE